ncbi:Flp family type IVb pilin [Microvirga terrae]|uniref:Flp family type IVb pilin n=1 Tax=Microvirga terrae TaxID=2740529 RepID=A0ABY5RMP4_9HYPH|nr:Flp family type IVb pilin [Microvirga terrae]UVF18498.1 Flp family type IVb pilin [Microvirga terrae]
MKSLVTRFVDDESGATAIEYGLIAGFVSIAIIAGLTVAGPKLTIIFNTIGEKLTAAAAGAGGGSGSGT